MKCNNPVAIGPYANGYCDKELKMVDGKMQHEGACAITPIASPAATQIPCDCINCRALREGINTVVPAEPLLTLTEPPPTDWNALRGGVSDRI